MFTPRIFPWLQRPNPVPQQELGLYRSLVPGPRFGPFIGHSHVRQPQPSPGVQDYAYEGLGLVEFSPIGKGVANRNYLFPLARGGTVFAAHEFLVQGLGGLSRGQFIGQPLLYDPSLQSEDLLLNPLGAP